MNRKEEPEQIMCRKEACAIQFCLQKHDYQVDKCAEIYAEWERCRDLARAKKQEARPKS